MMFSGKTMKIRIAALLITVIYLLSGPSSVIADIAPPPAPRGSNILPGETTQVRMVAETVTLDIEKTGRIRVEANFTMRNLGAVEERMEVYYPINYASPASITETCWSDPRRKPDPIGDLSAWVNGVSVPVKTKYARDGYAGAIESYIPCWGTFPAVFPLDEDVKIRITYTTQTSYYVLHTGAGWKDTIGRADITVRFPYEINEFNFLGCYYQMANQYGSDCQVNGNEIHWYDEDFDPDYDFNFTIVPADQWVHILNLTEQTQQNPEDGEAWGKLGLAYKNLLKRVDEKHPEIDEQGNEFPYIWFEIYNDRHLEIFRRSAEAYQKAVTLKPSDSDWHFGYAELLCHRILDLNYEGDFTQDAALCARELQLALENPFGPHHQDALRLLKKSANAQGQVIIDVAGEAPDYLILTPQAVISPTPAPSSTPILTSTPKNTRTPYSTWTLTITSTRRARTPRITKSTTLVSFYTPAPMMVTPVFQGEQSNIMDSNRAVWWERAALIASGFVLGIAWMWIRKRRPPR